jgi:DNA-binding XRE family transcriptional regulator
MTPEDGVEALRRAFSFIDGTVEPWHDHAYRSEAETAIRILDDWGFKLVRHQRKLTDQQADVIRARRSAGERGRALAAEFGVSEQTVCDISKGRRRPGGGGGARVPRHHVLVRVAPEILEHLKTGDVEPVVILGVQEAGDGTYDMTLKTPE